MSSEKPKRVHVTVRNRSTNESRGRTYYDVDVNEAFKIINDAFKKQGKDKRL